MNTAVALLMVVALEQTRCIAIKNEGKKDQKSQETILQSRAAVIPQRDERISSVSLDSAKILSTPYHHHPIDTLNPNGRLSDHSQRGEIRQVFAQQGLLHRDSSHSTKGAGKSKGGCSERHQEAGKRGEDLRENAKKEYGAHKGQSGGHVDGGRAEGNSGTVSDNKRHSQNKAGASKRNKKISRGFHEQYRKDEEKSNHGHWEHEHTEGRFIKFGKKRGHKGSKKADQSDQKQARSNNDAIPKDFKGMDQLVSIVWSNKKQPVSRLLSQTAQ